MVGVVGLGYEVWYSNRKGLTTSPATYPTLQWRLQLVYTLIKTMAGWMWGLCFSLVLCKIHIVSEQPNCHVVTCRMLTPCFSRFAI